MEINVEKFEKQLEDNGPLSESQKMAYAKLAQQVIDKLTMENYIKEVKEVPDSFFLLFGVYGIVSSSIFIAVYFLTDYDYIREDLKPIGISAAILTFFSMMSLKGAREEKRIEEARKKKLQVCLYIQNIIFFM